MSTATAISGLTSVSSGPAEGSAADPVQRPEPASARRLVAYVRTNGQPLPDMRELRALLRERLPEYMIPAVIVAVPSIPRTPNGKVDRKALIAAAPAQPAPAEPAAAKGPDKLEKHLLNLWAEVLGVEGIGPDDNFFELGGHSLIAMRLFSNIRETFGTRLPLATLFESPTVREMARLLRRQPETDTLRSPLVAVQPKGTRKPVFFVHGVGGEVLCFRQLAASLGNDQPFYGLQAKGIDIRDTPDTDVKVMAKRYIKAMRVVDPDGPYQLGGFSSGGTIAYEMARQLVESGKSVSRLIILENAPPNIDNTPPLLRPVSLWRVVRNLPLWIYDDLMQTDPMHALRRLRGRARITRDLWRSKRTKGKNTVHLAEADAQDFLGVTNLSDHRRNFLDTHYQALIDYTPPAMDIPLSLFISRTRPLLYRGGRDLGWSQVAKGGVDVTVLPGAHDSMLKEPHVQVLAKRIRRLLDEPAGHG